MLSARTTNTLNTNVVPKPNNSKMANKLKNSTNTKRGLGLGVNRNGLSNKPKPLQISTNTIHAQQQQQHDLKPTLKNNKNDNIDEPFKKKTQTPKTDKKTIASKITQSDENDIDQFIQESYDPLKDIYALDEELYQKVLKLELADDGLPKFDSSEPFDF